jgi:hypothetical protein
LEAEVFLLNTFNLQKEQADGDYQNLVCVLQYHHNLDLQGAVDMLTGMIEARVKEYADLKLHLPSFGPKIDPMLHAYHTALEHFTQGCIVWYYSSPRMSLPSLRKYWPMPNKINYPGYFRELDPLGKDQVVIELFDRSI